MRERAVQLEQREFVEYVMRNQNRIYRFILSLVPNYTEAEELSQQTVLTLWEKWESYDPNEDFLPWAFGIARNHVLNYIRKKSRRDEKIGLPATVLDQIAELRCKQSFDLDHRRDALHNCLDSLTTKQRTLIERYYDGDATVPNLAKQLGCTADGLYKTLQRIRRILFDCINRRVAAENG